MRHLQPPLRLDPVTWPPAKLTAGSEGPSEVRGRFCREGKGVSAVCYIPVPTSARDRWERDLPNLATFITT